MTILAVTVEEKKQSHAQPRQRPVPRVKVLVPRIVTASFMEDQEKNIILQPCQNNPKRNNQNVLFQGKLEPEVQGKKIN